MPVFLIEPATVVTVGDHKDLMAAWSTFGRTGLVGTFRCTKPLTDRQYRRLSVELRERLVIGGSE